MTEGPGLAFRKMHGAGNDFVVIDARGRADPVTPALARALGDRHRGVGFDQLAVLVEAEGADAGLIFWNADGSRAAACGNATRCVADLLLGEGRGPELVLHVAGRGEPLAARRRGDGAVEVDMGTAATDWRAIPLARDADTLALPLPGAPVAVSMGNPHAVHFVESLPAVALKSWGPAVETDPLFPERTNVQFVEVLDRGHVRARVWERGVGETLASGSSACAIAVAGHRRGLTDRRLAVDLPGGRLEIVYGEDGHCLLSGPVAHVFEGRLSAAWLAAAAAAEAAP
ncbi:diaminopimelate epimerase [Paralimibaculum aggregatum]|uniref:Diaminopimelate epimerase n=2 Tax=Paralimibaculum aggregatum TaxID=3036245 RepID=A0ABQ6LEU8_9RHOB|nr:diaminopimelate epimerase [Limibaculum sp. NKW23]